MEQHLFKPVTALQTFPSLRTRSSEDFYDLSFEIFIVFGDEVADVFIKCPVIIKHRAIVAALMAAARLQVIS